MHVRNYKIFIYLMCSNYTVESVVDSYLLNKKNTKNYFGHFDCSEVLDYTVEFQQNNFFSIVSIVLI